MKHKNKYFFVFITVLVLFALLAVNSQIVDQDTGLDTKLITIDKPTARGVSIPIEDAEAYVPLNYKFDDKFNYLIKAVGNHISFNMKFAFIGIPRTHKNYTNTLTYEALLADNVETHFWPSPLLQRIKIKGLGFLMIKKVPLNADTKKTRTHKPSTYSFAQTEHIPANKQYTWEYRAMGYSTELGDLWWIRNQEPTNFIIIIKNAAFGVRPHSSVVYSTYVAPGNIYLQVPKKFKSNIDVSFKMIGSFKKIAPLTR